MGSAFMALSAIFALIISSVRLLAKLYEYRLPTLCPLLNLDLETVKSLLISSVRRRYGIEAHRLFIQVSSFLSQCTRFSQCTKEDQMWLKSMWGAPHECVLPSYSPRTCRYEEARSKSRSSYDLTYFGHRTRKSIHRSHGNACAGKRASAWMSVRVINHSTAVR